MGRTLSLDTILSSSTHHLCKWSPECESNKAGRLLRYLLCRLYDQGRGQLVNARLTLAQTTISRKLGISRQWVHELLGRLQEAGWIEYTAPRLANGRRASCTYTIGRQFKRLLVMLGKSRKPSYSAHVNNAWHFSPTLVEKRLFSILEHEKRPPSAAVLLKIPLLGRWLQRGHG